MAFHRLSLEETHGASTHIPLTRPSYTVLTSSKGHEERGRDRCLIISSVKRKQIEYCTHIAHIVILFFKTDHMQKIL